MKKRITAGLTGLLFSVQVLAAGFPFQPNTVLNAADLNAAFQTAAITSGTIDSVTLTNSIIRSAIGTFTSLTSPSVSFTGGLIDGVPIGTASPAAGVFTTLAASSPNPAFSYQSSSTGGVARTYQSKLSDSVSVEDFGGSPFASAATNDAAFANAFAASKTVYVQTSGTWNYSTGLVLIGKTLRGKSKTDVVLHYTGTGIALAVGGSDANAPELSNFTLTGTASATAGLVVGNVSGGARRGLFKNLVVTGFSNAVGISLIGNLANGGVYYNTFINVASESNKSGWLIQSSDGATNGNRVNANTFLDCTAISNAGDGVFLDWGGGNTFSGFDREANTGYGFNTDHTLDTTLIGGYSENNVSGAVNKTANGNIRMFGGRTVDSISGVPSSSDLFMSSTTGMSVHPSGGVGFNATPVTNGINAVSTSDMPLQLSGTTYFSLDHLNGVNLANKAIRKNGVVRSSSAGVLSFAGVTTSYIEVSLTENVTSITMPSAIDGLEVNIVFTNGAGPFTVAGWPATVVLAGGVFNVSPVSGATDMLTLRYHSDLNKWVEVSRASQSYNTGSASNLTSTTAIPNQQTFTTGGQTLANQTAAASATWRIRAFGTYTAANSATGRNAQVSAYWGATQLPILSVPVLASVAQTTQWELEFVLSGSSTTAVWTAGKLLNKLNTPAIVAGTSAYMEQDRITPASTSVTAGAQTIDLRFATSASVPGDAWTIESVTIERLN